MNEYLTVDQVAESWSLSRRRVQILCQNGQISNVQKISGIWLIPRIAKRPIPLKSGVKHKKDLNVLSLFSGCGGMDLGFEGGFNVLQKSINTTVNPHWKSKAIDAEWTKLPETRFKTIFANDIRTDAQATWINYFSKKGIDPKTYCLDSIVDIVKLHQQNKIPVFPDDVDIVTGGFPCQDFSIAGKRNGFKSDKSHTGKSVIDEPSVENRGQLYMWMREVIAITKPKMFIAENVKGLISLQNVKDTIENDFASIGRNGYLVLPARVLHAADFGVPQNRERIIFLGFEKSALKEEALKNLSSENISDRYDPYPVPTHNFSNSIANNKRMRNFVTVSDALQDLDEPDKSSDPSQQKYSKAKFMGSHCQGQTEVNLNGISPTIRSEHHGNIEFRRLSKENGGKNKNELAEGLHERRLTVRECARIQTFPDDYDFVIPSRNGYDSVSASAAYKIIGNAVPPLLAFHIAKRLEDNWDLYFGD